MIECLLYLCICMFSFVLLLQYCLSNFHANKALQEGENDSSEKGKRETAHIGKLEPERDRQNMNI